MVNFKDGFSSESYYPDSNYSLSQDSAPEEDNLSEDKISNTPKFESSLGVSSRLR